MKTIKRAQYDKNRPEIIDFRSTHGPAFGGSAEADEGQNRPSSIGRRFAAIQDNAADLQRIGLALCLASSLMTVGSAVTLAVYLL